uniref:F-box domain-containing protein n=1 Tax=Parastrongyloides trichosuri TaxID=131310 RepID=A0A0N4ZZA3_PARTI
MNFEALPVEVIVNILVFLPFRSITNLMKVSKKFYNIIGRNYQKVNKLDIEYFSIESIHKENNNERYKLHIVVQDSEVYPSNKRIINENDIEPYEIEKYLKRLIFKKTVGMVMVMKHVYVIFDILYKYVKGGTTLDKIYLYIEKSPVEESFKKFINSIKNISVIHIDRLCFYPMTTRNEFNFLEKFNTLQRISINQCHCTRYISGDIIKKLIRNNVFLKRIKIIAYKCDIDIKIFECISEIEGMNIMNTSLYFELSISRDEKLVQNLKEYCESLIPSSNNNALRQYVIKSKNKSYGIDTENLKITDIHNFFKRITFKSSSRITIIGNYLDKLFDVLYQYTKKGVKAKSLFLHVDSSPVEDSLMKFIYSFTHISNLIVDRLCYYPAIQQKFIDFSKFYGLSKVSINECFCTKQISQEVLDTLCHKTPTLERLKLNAYKCDFNLEYFKTIPKHIKDGKKMKPLVVEYSILKDDDMKEHLKDHARRYNYEFSNYLNDKYLFKNRKNPKQRFVVVMFKKNGYNYSCISAKNIDFMKLPFQC